MIPSEFVFNSHSGQGRAQETRESQLVTERPEADDAPPVAPSIRTTRPAAAGNDGDAAPDQGRAGDGTAIFNVGNADNIR